MPKPVQPPRPPAEIKTNEELYLAGLRLEQFHSPALEPYPYYEEALRRDPGDSRVNVALAILFCKRGLYAEAERRLDAAIQRITGNYTSPKDGEAFYYLGVALKAQGKCEAAETAFHKAGWSQAWYGPSHYALAELACRRRDFEGAAEFVDRALSANASNTKALDLKAVLLRRLQRPGEAVAMSRRALSIDPLDYGALSETNLARFDVGRSVRGEAEKEMVPILRDPATSFLELAADYGACGLWDEAVNVLSQYILTAEDKARISPLVRYHLGYYLEQKGEIADAAQTYRLAAQTPADCCFPFQWESAEALRSAMKQNPTDARATYYLGNLLFDLQPEKAIEAWERSRAAGRLLCHGPPKPGAGVRANPGRSPQGRVEPGEGGRLRSAGPAAAGGVGRGLRGGRSRPATTPGRPGATSPDRGPAGRRPVAGDRAGSAARKYDRAIGLLDHHFHLWEGQTGIHDVYVDAHLLRGQQHFKAGRYAEALADYAACLDYPDRFETGRPQRDEAKAAQVHYFLGTVYEAIHDPAQAREHFERTVRARPGWTDARYYQALAHRELGQDARAAECFDGLIRSGKERLESPAKADFFAKFGVQQSDRVRKARAHYLIGLGKLGKGDHPAAKAEFQKALDLEASHLGARMMLD